MKKSYCLLIAITILLLHNKLIHPQQIRIDSLQGIISQANGEKKVDLMLELANELFLEQKMLEYSDLTNRIYILADSIKYDYGKCASLELMGIVSFRNNNYRQAQNYYLEAYYTCKDSEYIELLSSILFNVEDTYIAIGKYDSALHYNEKAILITRGKMDFSNYILHLSQRIKINLYAGKIKQSTSDINELDSLLKLYPDLSNIEKIYQIQAYANYYFGNYNKAISIFKILEEYYEKKGSVDKLAVTCGFLGNTFFKLTQTDSAIYYQKKSINCKPADINLKGTAISYNSLGAIFKSRNEYEKALINFHESAKIKKQINDTIGLAITNMNIATVYRSMENYDKAIEYNRKSLKIFLRNKIQKSISYVYNNLGYIYKDIEVPDSAYYYYQKAFILKKKLNDISGISDVANGLGNYFFEMEHNMDSALYYHNIALSGFKKLNDIYSIAETNVFIADCYYFLGNYKEAVSTYIKCIPELEKERSYENLEDVYKYLAAAYYETGRYKLSYDALSKHLQLHDSIFSTETMRTIADMQEKYDSDLKEKENHVLQQNLNLTKTKNKVMRLYIWLLLVFLALMFATIVFVFLFSRYKRRAVLLKLQLAEQEKRKIQAEYKIRELEEKRLNQIIFAEKQISKLHQERLEQSREKLHSTSLQIIKQNQRFATVLKMLENIGGINSGKGNGLDEIIRFVNQSMDQEVDWIRFRHDFEQSYPGLLDRLSEKFPHLTERELQFLALTRTRLTSRQIADILCIEENSVKKDRSRIKKKMNIEPGISLYDFLCSF